MIRLLCLIFLIIVSYLGFSIINEYDTNIHIEVLNYNIDISSFFALSIMLVVCIIISLFIKLLSFIINTPNLISQRIKTSKTEHNIKQLINAYSFILSGNKSEARALISRIKNELPTELTAHIYLLLSELETEAEQKSYNLKHLLDFPGYKHFATKALAEYFFKYQYYQQSLEYIKQTPNLKNDIEAQKILITIYAKLQNWEECENSINNLESLKPELLKELEPEIANLYFVAAKTMLENGEDDRAAYYLKQSLTYQTNFIEAIDLLCSLNINSGKGKLNKPFIENAFAISPSFELCELYARSTNLKAKETYQELASLVDSRKHLGVFMAFAAYLGLDDEIKALKESIE